MLHRMRLTQYRVTATPAHGGLIQVGLLKVFYSKGHVAGHEIVLLDWCEPDQLEQLATQFLRELSARVARGEWGWPE